MQVYIEQNTAGWTLIPTEGRMAGEILGDADFVALSHVVPQGSGFVGEIDRVWGLVVKNGQFHDEPALRHAVCGTKRWYQDNRKHRPLTHPVRRAIFDAQGVAW